LDWRLKGYGSGLSWGLRGLEMMGGMGGMGFLFLSLRHDSNISTCQSGGWWRERGGGDELGTKI